MTEVPGTDRDEAREKLLEDTPLVPEDIEVADDDPASRSTTGDRGDAGELTGDDGAPEAPPPSA